MIILAGCSGLVWRIHALSLHSRTVVNCIFLVEMRETRPDPTASANLADPVPAIACIKHFPGYRVATKHLELDFLRIGNSDLVLHFDISDAQIATIQQELLQNQRATPCFEMHFIRADGKICTKIRNTVAIRPLGYTGKLEGTP